MKENFAYYKRKIGIVKITYDSKIKKIEIVDYLGENIGNPTIADNIMGEIDEYLEAKRFEFSPIDIDNLPATDFQKEVWKEVYKIPYGSTRSYKDIAISINRPKAVRAVATAIGKNPLMIVIPCHRVIGSDGFLHGYAYGLDIKKYLLDLEENNIKNRKKIDPKIWLEIWGQFITS